MHRKLSSSDVMQCCVMQHFLAGYKKFWAMVSVVTFFSLCSHLLKLQ